MTVCVAGELLDNLHGHLSNTALCMPTGTSHLTQEEEHESTLFPSTPVLISSERNLLPKYVFVAIILIRGKCI